MPRAGRLCSAVAVFAVMVALATGCEPIAPFGDECSSDADCSAGHQCGGLLGKSCNPTCEVVECADGFACVEGWFGAGATCRPTCAVIECAEGTVCVDGWFGSTSCEPGCQSNDECPAGTFCANSCFIFCGDKAPQCEPGCRDDSECALGEFCRNGSCLVQCSSHSDCGPRSVCVPDFFASALPDGGSSCGPGARCSCFDCPPGSPNLTACGAVDGGTGDGAAAAGSN